MKSKFFVIILAVIFSFTLIHTSCGGNDNYNSGENNSGENNSGENNSGNENPNKFIIRNNLTTQQLVEEMGMGINLGNTLEACGDWINKSSINNFITAWGAPVPTQAQIQGYADAGFKSLRIPVAWSNLMNMSNYTIHEPLFQIVENVINWTIDAGMIALVNLHWDGGWYFDYDQVALRPGIMARYTAIWTQICERFKDYGDMLMFESANEVEFHGFNQYSWNNMQKKQAFDLMVELDQAFINIVRGSGGNNADRHLLLQTYLTNDAFAVDPLFTHPVDPRNRFALSVHYYSPALFIFIDPGVDSGWGPGAIGWETWGSTKDLNDLHNDFYKLKTNLVDKGVPVIIGEFAVCSNRSREQIRLWTVSVAEKIYEFGMCPMLWDTPGQEYDRVSLTWRDPILIEQLMEIPGRHPRN